MVVVDRVFGREPCDGGRNLSGLSSTMGLELDEDVFEAFRCAAPRVSCWCNIRLVVRFLLMVKAILDEASIMKGLTAMELM